ncbi:pseudouridylate synthase [Pelobium manganitolerans]|uniref:Pseudouridine synthase n=1 Tax=Pelobium manganitolerans TaxID=1842495 RepID=A0A419S5C9_9SPHI|nr:pseudouridine synthase [Pelobium manganitolerans]RKD15273.1 pseudouridylate synthase [Pelobium manganitolerans]
MPFNKNRNSRDDKSGKDFNKSNRSESTGRSKSENYPRPSFSDDRNERSYKKPYGSRDGDSRSYRGSNERTGERKSFGDRKAGGDSYRDRKDYGERGERYGERKSYGDRKPYGNRDENYGERKSFGKRNDDRNPYGERKPYSEREENFSERKTYGEHKRYGEERDRFNDRKSRSRKDANGKAPFRSRNDENRKPFVSSDRDFNQNYRRRDDERGEERPNRFRRDDDHRDFGDDQVRLKRSDSNKPAKKNNELIRLNRYIANAGICSRRKADELIEAGVISVNNEVITELGTKVNPATDEVRYNGELLKREKMVYVLLNKPKDYITTTDDPQERKTVMELVSKASSERIYPVGRLDRNTTGLLLLTNDGDLAEKLSHPKNSISKIYNVELDKNLTQGDFNKIAFGVELEDGLIKPDEISYVKGGSKREIGIQIHSGKNRIVRRIFESLGYEVEKLDRVIYANLTKKDLPRGRWRYLTDMELVQLKHFTKVQ